jgi:translocation and assembly module TamB
VRVDGFAVDRIELGTAVLGQPAAFALRGDAAAESGSLSANATLQRLDAPGQVALRLALAPGEQLDAEVTADDPAGGVLAGLSGQPNRPLSLHLHLAGPASGATLTLRAALGEGVGIEASGTVSATADGALGLRLAGEAGAAPLLPAVMAPLATPLGFEVAARLAPDRRLALETLVLAAPFGRLSASGTLELDTEVTEMRLHAALAEGQRFAALLPPGLGWSALAAEAQLGGTLRAPRLVADVAPEGLTTGIATADAALDSAPRLHLEAALPEQRLLFRLEGAAARFEISGIAGDVLDLAARLELPRLAALGPGFDGAASLEATVRGPRQDPEVTMQARSGQIIVQGQRLQELAVQARVSHPLTRPDAEASGSGRYGGQPLSLALRARPEGGTVVLERAEAALGATRLEAAGSLELATRLANGTLRLEAPELARLAGLAGRPGLAGRLSVQARLHPQDGVQGFDLKLDTPRLEVGGVSGSIQATARGTPAAADFTLAAQAPQGRVTARGQASTGAAGWYVALAALEAGWLQEVVRLANPARISGPAGGGVEIGALALTTGRGGRLEVSGGWGPVQADLTGRVTAFPLALVQAVAPSLGLQGRLDGTARVTGPVAQPMATAQLAATGIRTTQAGLATLPPASLRAEARLAGRAVTLTAEAEAGAVGRLRATLALPEGAGGALAGTLDGTLDVSPLAAPFIAAGADRVTGRMTLGLRATGSVVAPLLSGRVALANGSYRNLALGVRLSEIGGALVGGATSLRLEGISARTAGGGRIELSGGLQPTAPGLPVELALTARNARLLASDLATATMDAELRLAGLLLAGAQASGSVTVQRADIRVPEQLPASIASLPNVRQIGPLPPGHSPAPVALAAAGTVAPPVDLALEVAVRRAFIRGRGLDAELAGRMQLGGNIAAPVVTGGVQMTRGTLSILARQLTFQRGTIGFASGTLMPQLDFAASTTTSSATLTVNIAGTPEAPQVTFSSSPELPQDEILARLIFDRPTSRLSPFEIVQLAGAVAELTGATSSSGVVDRVRGRLGLDRLGVTSDPTMANGAAVEAGRYVAPGLYLGVRQGTGGNTGVGVQYEVTRRLKLEGQTATGPAGDRVGLSYEVEY